MIIKKSWTNMETWSSAVNHNIPQKKFRLLKLLSKSQHHWMTLATL